MEKLRKPNGDYTEAGLKYPGMTADIDLCYKYLFELCQIVWAGNPNRPTNMVMWSIPPQPNNFNLQILAALDELKEYRDTGLSPERVAELAEAERERDVNPEMKTAYDEKGMPYFIEAEGSEAKHIIDLLQAESDGRLVVLPCSFDSSIYRINEKGDKFFGPTIEWGIDSFTVYPDEVVINDDSDNAIKANEIGMTVFLTQEEAETALERREAE